MNSRRIFWVTALIAGGVFLGWRIWTRLAVETTSRPKHALSAESAPFFQEITKPAGLTFRHWCGDSGKYFFPEIMGSGIALFDYDQDGDLDIFLVQGMPLAATTVKPIAGGGFSATSRLFAQTSKGHFEDVTAAVGLEDHAAYGMGAAVGDVNNDGWPDLFVSKYGSNRLFLNREGKFEEFTEASGIDNPGWGASACFVDFDRDGWLDLYVVNYVDYYPSHRFIPANGRDDYTGPHSFQPVSAKLFRNLTGEGSGKQPRFRDKSLEMGIDAQPGPGLGVLPADLSGDGWVDLYAANDGKANFLWVNRGGQRFVDEAIQVGAAYNAAGAPQASMGVAAGDVDGDGRQDLFMTHIDGEYSTLYLQVAPGIFEDRTASAGLVAPTIHTTGFGTALVDLDLDGDLDLVKGNGHVRLPPAAVPATSLESFWEPYAQRNQILLNDGDGIFVTVAAAADGFLAQSRVTRGLAVGDLDNDGDLDVVTSEVNGPARIFLNVAPRKGSWLIVRAIDPRHGGRDAYGATVTVTAGKLRLSRDINPAFSYLSSNDPRAHFGLGMSAKFDRIDVSWPDGAKETFQGGNANAFLTLRRGEGALP
ncbi:MAG: CRTAC1 family protein [Pirellulaceae bacterium]|nr:CRTAC1 family protein [Pirellulaceae bacterium]